MRGHQMYPDVVDVDSILYDFGHMGHAQEYCERVAAHRGPLADEYAAAAEEIARRRRRLATEESEECARLNSDDALRVEFS